VFQVRIWEVDTGRCVSRFTLPFCAGEDDDGISAVSFNPNADLPLLAVAAASKVLIYHTALGSDAQNAAAHELLSSAIPDASDEKQHARWSVGKNLKMHTTDAKKSAAETIVDEPIDVAENVPRCCAVIEIRKVVRKGGLSWHAKGDYLCSVSIENAASSVLIHRLSKRQTQTPFAKSKGTVQSVLFHPEKPFLFVATQQHVRVYNLVQQGLLKKLQCSVQRISSLALHPGGDNLIIGSEDRRVCWFDMDLSTKPYKTIKYHKGAVNGVSFHRTYPLFCSASSDGAVHVFHATVYSDLLQNPLVVPVKVLHAHSNGVLDCAFHPTQPWIFTAGNDQTLKLFH
jgi:ribosome biogenesis protein ERB1